MYRQLEGRGLLAFSDPAGAKTCLGLAAILKAQNPTADLTLVSNKSYDFYAQWTTPVWVAREAPAEFEADWVFTGTSNPIFSRGFELEVIRTAKVLGIPTRSFIDHWTGYALRFEVAGERIYPDRIIVVDEHAREGAIADGIPPQLLRVHRNPYLEFISRFWTPSLTREDIACRTGIANVASGILLYAPDPVSLHREDGWSFDEGDILVDLISALEGRRDVSLLVKPHPLQPAAEWEPGIRLAEQMSVSLTFADDKTDTLELINAADLIVGIQSNFLVEADALGKSIIRYFPGSPELDAIGHLRIGIKVETLGVLRNAIAAALGPSAKLRSLGTKPCREASGGKMPITFLADES